MDKLILRDLDKEKLDECVDLYIDVFSREPWNDVYESRQQVENYFINSMKSNYFIGYVVLKENRVVGMSVGMKKAWIEGIEYYIDEFAIAYEEQGSKVGSWFINEIYKDLENKGMNAIILNTGKDTPAYEFYKKNGFVEDESLRIFVR